MPLDEKVSVLFHPFRLPVLKILKSFLQWIVAVFGQQIRDERTGKLLGKALVFSLGTRPWLIGLHHPYVRPVFLPEKQVKYGRHRMGFATHSPVDFARILPLPAHAPSISSPSLILWAILVHQSAKECRALLKYWQKLGFDPSNILLVHGGSREDFSSLDPVNAVFVPDANLRTARHPVEKQSYAGPMREISKWMSGRSYRYICLVEYDHLPLVSDWGRRLEELLVSERADVLFHHLVRVDGTNAPHYLYHQSDPEFYGAWEHVSRREDPHVVLNCMATGSFWIREAFVAVADNLNFGISHLSSLPVYVEMELPTTAHHLGYRIRDCGSQNEFVKISPQNLDGVSFSRAQGAWSLHPVKEKMGSET